MKINNFFTILAVFLLAHTMLCTVAIALPLVENTKEDLKDFSDSFSGSNKNCLTNVSGGGEYCYTSTKRTLGDDNDIPSFIAAMSKNPLKTIQTVINAIPGMNLIVPPIQYMVAIGILSLTDGEESEGEVKEGGADFLEGLIMAGGMIVNMISPSDSEGISAVALETIFQANLHCKYQKVYLEETQFLTKMETSPDGGYPVFPIYPMVIPVDENTGQCSLKPILTSHMRPMIFGNAVNTKCSFSYSATSDTCLEKLGIPIFTEYTIQVPIVASICAIGGGIGGVISAIGSTVATAVTLFLDNKLALDPIVMKAVINTQNFLEIVFDLVASIISGSWICLGAKVQMARAMESIANLTLNIVALQQYNKAYSAIQNVTFCGHDWLSYKKTEDGKYWIRGNYEYSHYKYVIDKIEGVGNSSDEEATREVKNKVFREYTYGGREYDSGLPELTVSSASDNRANYLLYDIVYCIDPRTDEQKGFDTLGQRYYMRGNERANFACSRFFYDGESGCYLHSSDVSDEDKESGEFIVKDFKSIPSLGFKNNSYFSSTRNATESAQFTESQSTSTDSQIYEKIFYTILGRKLGKVINDNKYYLVSNEKYSRKCQEVFIEARKCCKHRSKNMVCLEDKTKNRTNANRHTFCFSNIVEGYDAPSSNLFTFLKERNKDLDKSTCYIGGTSFETGKKKNTNFVCVFSHDMCPYDFKLNAGLNYRASYCDTNYFTNYQDPVSILTREATHFNAATCREGLFSEKFRKKYKDSFGGSGGTKFAAFMYKQVQKDMNNFNEGDFEKIYNFDGVNRDETTISQPFTRQYFSNYNSDDIDVIRQYGFRIRNLSDSSKVELLSLSNSDVNKLKSSAFGKVKNFCQYRAHCVEVEREENYGDSSIPASLFLDSSCSGTTSNSRNILPDNGGGLPRQLSAPVVECIFESLKNLIQGIAGNSLCEDQANLNSNGFCGTDSENTVLQHLNSGDRAFFAGKYKMIDGKFIVKNQTLPDSYNPFLKIQKYFISIIRAALALFMAIYFYKQLITGSMESFIKPENLSKLVFTLFKFVIVIWLIFYNGWQQGAYSYLVNFSTAGYSFVNNIFTKVVKNPKNQIINFAGEEKRLRVIQRDHITEEEKELILCFKYNILDKITFAMRDSYGKCPRGFYSNYIANYSEAAQIIVKKRAEKRQVEPNIVIANNAEISKLLYFVDSYNKTNQNKLIIEIKTGENSWGSHLDDGHLWEPNYDGCYFDTSEYREDKNYLSMFDTLDCKLIRYLGYSTNNMAPNLILYSVIMLVPSLIFPDGLISSIISGIGAFLFGLMMTFIFIIFNIVIKTIYLFTSAFFTLSVLIFLSPIILPLMFFEKTKKIFDSWVENIMDSIIKPILNFAFTIIYVNIMDMILLKNATFEKHSNIGRGAGLVCPVNASSFICLINGFPVVSQIKILFTAGLFNVLIDAVIIFLFFQLSDSILDDVDTISSSIFKLLGDSPSGKTVGSSSLLNPKTFGAQGVSESLESAMEAGKKLENFRATYINNAPGAALEAVRRTSADAAKTADEAGNKKLASVLGAPAALIEGVGNKKDKLVNRVASLKDNLKNRASDFTEKKAKVLKRKIEALKGGSKPSDKNNDGVTAASKPETDRRTSPTSTDAADNDSESEIYPSSESDSKSDNSADRKGQDENKSKNQEDDKIHSEDSASNKQKDTTNADTMVDRADKIRNGDENDSMSDEETFSESYPSDNDRSDQDGDVGSQKNGEKTDEKKNKKGKKESEKTDDTALDDDFDEEDDEDIKVERQDYVNEPGKIDKKTKQKKDSGSGENKLDNEQNNEEGEVAPPARENDDENIKRVDSDVYTKK